MVNILKEIEARYPTDKITVNGEQAWPLIRIKYYYKYEEITSRIFDNKSPRKQSSYQKIMIIKTSLYGWRKWFKKYDFFAISNSTEGIKKIINNVQYDRLIDPIIDIIGEDKFLYIEKPFPVHHSPREVHTKNVVSYNFILLLTHILERFIKLPEINGVETLDSIKNKYNLKINDSYLLKHFYAKKKIYKILYRILKPRILFVVCYYDNIAAIKAAKEMDIMVVEIQHGSIGFEHPAYNIYIDLDNSYFPDYLLVFGKEDVSPFKSSKFIDPKNVYSIGSYYLEYFKEQFKPDDKFIKELRKYKKRCCITLQWTVEAKIIDFVVKAAKFDDSICFLIVPRKPLQRDYSLLELPSNVKVITDKDFYEMMMYVDFHSTAYSTCALEAPSLGVQNIMINIDNISKIYYGDALNDEKITKYVDAPKEYINVIKNFKKLDVQTIMQSNENNIALNYVENLKKFINKIDL